MPNNRNQRDTAGFGSLWPWVTWSGKFRRVAETSFCKGGTAWATWSPLCYRTEFRPVDMFCKSTAKQSESTQNSRIWQPLAFADMREVSKSFTCRILFQTDLFNYSHIFLFSLSKQTRLQNQTAFAFRVVREKRFRMQEKEHALEKLCILYCVIFPAICVAKNIGESRINIHFDRLLRLILTHCTAIIACHSSV